MRFEFATASRIIFGPGTLGEVAPVAAEMGRRPLAVTGRSGDRAAPLMDALQEQGYGKLPAIIAGGSMEFTGHMR